MTYVLGTMSLCTHADKAPHHLVLNVKVANPEALEHVEAIQLVHTGKTRFQLSVHA